MDTNKIVREEEIFGCNKGSDDHACIKKLFFADGKIIFKKKYRPDKMYAHGYWAGRERDLLMLLNAHKVNHVVKAASWQDNHKGVLLELETWDAGFTIDQWFQVPVRLNLTDETKGYCPFAGIDEFLKMVRGCLLALQSIHKNGFVHCDIKASKICLPCYVDANGKTWLEYSNTTLINFSYSIVKDNPAFVLKKTVPVDDAAEDYHSPLHRKALKEDALFGLPELYQQLDYSCDLFSLGRMARKMFDALEEKAGWLDPIGGKFIGHANLEAIIDRLEEFSDGIPEEYREQDAGFAHLRLINTIDEFLRHINADPDTSFSFVALKEKKEGEQQNIGSVTTQIGKQTPCRNTNELSATLSKFDSATSDVELELKERPTQQISTSKSEDQSTDLTKQVNNLHDAPSTPPPELDKNYRSIEQHDKETGKRRRSRRRRRDWSWLPRNTPQEKFTLAIGITLFVITVFLLLPNRDEDAHVATLSTSKTPESVPETIQKSSVTTPQPSTASPSPQLRPVSRKPSQQTEPDVVWTLYKEIKQTSFYQTGQGEKPEQWNRFLKLLTDKEEKGNHKGIALMSALRQQGKGVELDQAAALRGYFLIMNDEKADSQLLTQVSKAAAELTRNAIEMHDSDTVRLLLPEIKKMAESEKPYWQMMVGEVYRLGIAGSPSPKEAAVWYEKATAQSNDARIRQWAEQSLEIVQ